MNAKINSALIFPIILTLLWLVFSKEAILFLIYLLPDKANYVLVLNIFRKGKKGEKVINKSSWQKLMPDLISR